MKTMKWIKTVLAAALALQVVGSMMAAEKSELRGKPEGAGKGGVPGFHVPKGVELPAETKKLLAEFNAKRDAFRENQKAIIEKLKGATDAEKEKIKAELKAGREKFLDETKQLRTDLREQLSKIREELKEKGQWPAEDRKGRGRGRGN